MPAKRGGSRIVGSSHKGESTPTYNEVGGYHNTWSIKATRAGGHKKVLPTVSYDTLYKYDNFQILDGTSIGLLNDDEPVEKYIQEAAAYLRENKDIKAFSIRYSVNVASNKRRLFYHTGTDLVSKDPSTSPKYTVYSYLNIEYKASTMPPFNPIKHGVPYPLSPYLTEIRLNNLNVDENKENELVGTVSSVLSKSSSSASVSYTVDDNNQNKFEIVGSQLKTIGYLDYETKSSYDILITATVDNSFNPVNNVMTVPFTISVINDAGEGPTSITLTGTTIDENLSGLYTIGQLSADNVTSAQFTMPESTEFQINGIYLQKKDGVILDYETQSSYSIEITATDQFSNSYSQTFTITVIDTNDAPFDISLSSNTKMEMSAVGTVVGTLSTSDEDNIAGQAPTQTHTYSIAQSTDEPFRIEGNQLVINKSDLEASTYSISITSTDSGSPSRYYTKMFDIYIQAYIGPSNISLSSTQIAENSVAGTTVGTLSATAGDSNDITFTVDDEGNFEIVEYILKTKVAFDHEIIADYTIIITATDNNNKTSNKAFIITVTDVVEGPTDIQLSGNKEVNENMSVGYVIGTLSATAGDSNEFSFTVDDDTNFIVEGSYLKTNASFDYETKSSYLISITVTDGNQQTFTKNFTISVVDVNEAPHTMTLSSNTLTAGSDAFTTIGELQVTDPDAGDTISSWSVDDASLFTIEVDPTDSKKATLKSYIVIGTAQTKTITVIATDSGGLNVSTSFDIVVEQEPGYLMFTYDTGDPNVPLGDVFALAVKGSSDLEYTVEWSNGQISGKTDDLTPFGGHAHMMSFPSSSTAWAKIVMTAGSAQRLGTQDYRAWDGLFVTSSAENFLTEVKTNSPVDWGLPGLISLFNGFTNCTHLQEVPDTLPDTVTDLRYCFQRAIFTTTYDPDNKIVSRPFLNWDMSNVEKFDLMFSINAGDDWLTEEDFSGWNTSKATTMRYMFQYQRSFVGNGLDQWDTSQSTDFSNMFEFCNSMNVNLRGWTVDISSNLTNMFSGATAMNTRYGSGGAEETEYYGNTPDIQFFNVEYVTNTPIYDNKRVVRTFGSFILDSEGNVDTLTQNDLTINRTLPLMSNAHPNNYIPYPYTGSTYKNWYMEVAVSVSPSAYYLYYTEGDTKYYLQFKSTDSNSYITAIINEATFFTIETNSNGYYYLYIPESIKKEIS